MAGFEVIIYGRFWVITEASDARSVTIECRKWSKHMSQNQ
jgi:hypothetical protein